MIVSCDPVATVTAAVPAVPLVPIVLLVPVVTVCPAAIVIVSPLPGVPLGVQIVVVAQPPEELLV